MPGFFNVIAFDIRENPNVTRIFSERITRMLSRLWPFKILLARVFLWNANWIKIEKVIIGLRVPHDDFISARESLGAMQPMLKMPDNAVFHLHSKPFKNRMKE